MQLHHLRITAGVLLLLARFSTSLPAHAQSPQGGTATPRVAGTMVAETPPHCALAKQVRLRACLIS